MRRTLGWSVAGVMVVVGVVVLSAPVWADDAGSPPPPASPTQGPSTDAVTPSVSSDRVAVPDVTGLSLQQATDRIEAAGLTISAASFGDKEPAPDEVASCQAPEGGSLVEENTKVLVIFE